MAEEPDYFDYQGTVTELTVQFLSEFEETRVAALKWLIMLHQKAPKKVCISLFALDRSCRVVLRLLTERRQSAHGTFLRSWLWTTERSPRC